jgi:hypothetical protein
MLTFILELIMLTFIFITASVVWGGNRDFYGCRSLGMLVWPRIFVVLLS